MRDVAIHDRYGVTYVSYWFDPADQRAFCLVRAPGKEAAQQVHLEAHGEVASSIIRVDPARLDEFFSEAIEQPRSDRPASALRTILFTDLESSTSLTLRLGDSGAMRFLRWHDGILRRCMSDHAGRLIKHTGDGVMASFTSVVRALECAVEMQHLIDGRAPSEADPLARIRVGLSVGEPVSENEDLFGAAIQMASRICAMCVPGTILVSGTVRDTTIAKSFDWGPRSEATLKGFEEPVAVYELRWRTAADADVR